MCVYVFIIHHRVVGYGISIGTRCCCRYGGAGYGRRDGGRRMTTRAEIYRNSENGSTKACRCNIDRA